jgi:DNA-3-methyladenine glycosylase
MNGIDDLRAALESHVVRGAIALLGCDLVCGEVRARIVEAEAYRSSDDPGSHAYRGRTPRNLVMFGPPGRAYVYFTYGNHWMLNVACEPEGRAAAVLLRAARPLTGLQTMRARRPKARNDRELLSGPGKLAAGFGLTGEHNGIDLLSASSKLRLEAGAPPKIILVGKRIGLASGRGDATLWRFVDGDSIPWVSRPVKDLMPFSPEEARLRASGSA